jgi:cell division protein FtsQ
MTRNRTSGVNTAVMGRKARRNVSRKSDLRRPVGKGEVIGGLALDFGRVLGVVCRWALVVAFLVCVSTAILLAYRWVTEHDFFRLATLQVTGGQRLGSDEIAAMGGVTPGCNILDLNIAEIQRRIAASEWVESVSVSRILPDGLTIAIKERVPFFLVRRDARLFYADVTGQPIAAVGVDKFISLPLLDKEEGVSLGPGFVALLDEIGRNTLPFGMRQIAWIRQDSAEQFSLFLEGPRVLVQLDGKDLQATLACLIKLWADLERRGELDLTTSMFVMPGRAWVRFRAAQSVEETL